MAYCLASADRPRVGELLTIPAIRTEEREQALFARLLGLGLLRVDEGLPCRSHLERVPGAGLGWTIVLRAGLSYAEREREIRLALGIVRGLAVDEANDPTLRLFRGHPSAGS